MPSDQTVRVYVATYPGFDAAKADYDVVTRLCSGAGVHTYDATVIGPELDGKLKIVTADRPDRSRAWIGLAVGSLAGLFVPPFLLWDDPIGAATGETMGDFWRGLSRADLKVIADMLQRCQAALIVINDSELQSLHQGTTSGTFREFEKTADDRRRRDDARFAAKGRPAVGRGPRTTAPQITMRTHQSQTVVTRAFRKDCRKAAS